MSDPIRAHLKRLRTEHERFLSDRCTILRVPRTRQRAGAEAGAAVVVALNVPCHLRAQEQQAGEVVSGGRLVSMSPWLVRLPVEICARTSDKQYVRPNDPATKELVEVIETMQIVIDDRTFEIEVVQGPTSHEMTRNVGCKEMR